MKKISTVVQGIDLSHQETKHKRQELDETTVKIVDVLFDRLKQILPAFKNAWPSKQEYEGAKKQWILAFMLAGVNDLDMIKHGLDKLRLSPNPFVPSPGQFIEMCQATSEELGLPSLEDAYQEACQNSHPASDRKWSHPTIRHAWANTGSWRLREDARSKSFPLFKKNFEFAIKLYRDGNLLDQLENNLSQSRKINKDQELKAKIAEPYRHVRSASQAIDIINKILKS